VKIPKAQKNTVKSSVVFALWGSSGVKATHKMLMKLTPVIYEQLLRAQIPKTQKDTVDSTFLGDLCV